MDPANYYQPPRADLDAPAAAASAPLPVKLFSLRQIGVASFLGGPLAGTMLIADNYRATARPDSARSAVIAGAIASIVVAVLALFLPDRVPGSSLSIAYVVATHGAAKAAQGLVAGAPLRGRGSGPVQLARSANQRVVSGLLVRGRAGAGLRRRPRRGTVTSTGCPP